jgi:hypothetical protein
VTRCTEEKSKEGGGVLSGGQAEGGEEKNGGGYGAWAQKERGGGPVGVIVLSTAAMCRVVPVGTWCENRGARRGLTCGLWP